VFAAMLLVIVVRMFGKKQVNKPIEKVTKPHQFSLTGMAAGIITSLSGLGGGVVMTPVFTDLMQLNIRKATSIANGVIPLFAVVLGIYNLLDQPKTYVSEWQFGYIVFPIVLPLIAATFLFAPYGVKVAQKTKPTIIRFVFATFASLMLIKLLYEIFTH
jgi:uncharacterized membrane protein YfcA